MFKMGDKVKFDLEEYTKDELINYDSKYNDVIDDIGTIWNCYDFHSDVVFEDGDDVKILVILNMFLKKQSKFEEIMYIKDGQWVKEMVEL